MIKHLHSRPAPRLLGAPKAVPVKSHKVGDPVPTFAGSTGDFYEDVGEGGVESSMCGFSPEGGKSSRLWQCAPANIDALNSIFPLILGGCQYTETGTGKLARTLPQADPLYPWMYASAIPTIQGYGTYTKTTAAPSLEASGFPYGALWSQYRMAVESLPRPFPILPDNLIPTSIGTWYPETGAGTSAFQYVVAQEQNRFCTWELIAQNDYITIQNAQLQILSSDAFNNRNIPGFIKIFLPNQLYKVTWYYVPIRLVISAKSYLRRWLGRINQNAFSGPDNMYFEPGELLYLSYTQKMFTPPIQQVVALGGDGGNIISTDKFCNIEMLFLYTQRTLFSTPSVDPTNNNYVIAGHNLLPYNTGKFYYASNKADPFQPPWLSAPLETLWTDCDSVGGVP